MLIQYCQFVLKHYMKQECCRERKLYEKAYAFAKKGTVIEKPVNDQNGMFFCLAQAYLFGIWDEYAMACYFLGKYEEADKLFTKLFEIIGVRRSETKSLLFSAGDKKETCV